MFQHKAAVGVLYSVWFKIMVLYLSFDLSKAWYKLVIVFGFHAVWHEVGLDVSLAGS